MRDDGRLTVEMVRSSWFLDIFLKVELTKFADRLVMGCERKREVKDDTRFFATVTKRRHLPIIASAGGKIKSSTNMLSFRCFLDTSETYGDVQ